MLSTSKKNLKKQSLIIILGITLIFFVYYLFPKIQKKILEKQSKNINPINIFKSNTLEDVEYVGKDENGREYLITAKFANLSDDTEDLIKMINIQSKLTLKDGEIITISSNKASYKKSLQTINYEENVKINYQDFVLVCNNAEYFGNKSKIYLYEKVLSEFVENKNSKKTLSTITADQMILDIDNKTILAESNNKKKVYATLRYEK